FAHVRNERIQFTHLTGEPLVRLPGLRGRGQTLLNTHLHQLVVAFHSPSEDRRSSLPHEPSGEHDVHFSLRQLLVPGHDDQPSPDRLVSALDGRYGVCHEPWGKGRYPLDRSLSEGPTGRDDARAGHPLELIRVQLPVPRRLINEYDALEDRIRQVCTRALVLIVAEDCQVRRSRILTKRSLNCAHKRALPCCSLAEADDNASRRIASEE